MTPKIQTLVQDWDHDIQMWLNGYPAHHPVIAGRMGCFDSFIKSGGLSGDYLPEPYYGDPDNCSTVVVNINPGSSCPNEDTKNIHNLTSPTTGKMIYDFANQHTGCYSSFQKAYSPFVAQSWVPGVNWWKDYRNDYINNIVGLYCSAKGKSLPEMMPAPFAFELCPLHSVNIGKINFSLKRFLPTYLDNVFAPSRDILTHSVIPFGLGFSSLVNGMMFNCKAYEIIETWKNGKDSKGNQINKWPTDSKGLPKKRTYVLLKGTSEETAGSYFLNTWDGSGQLIKIREKMMEEFKDVDKYIINEIVRTFGI